ncbi:ABC transporter ATP-binding protein [Aureimonas populi]|uniref:ABC transporter ATP-binding protein n=1 Tax=Aureimonas populi TaxID=1701758 RepID=A0ABW5CP17_9HYPH|nr:ABC transporter ATP-binding protein [Aureimonas populi]
MIRLVNVEKTYPTRTGPKTVFSGLSYDFPRGENTGILGPNGAGKSTLMRLLSGAELPDRGRVERGAQVSWPLGFAGGLHGSLTGRENVAFVSRLYGKDYGEILDFVEDFAEIGRNMANEVKTYSSGMKARVAFGLSMAINFDYYLIDEVIAVGDASFKRKCRQVLDDRLGSATVILVSHSAGLLREFCETGCVLEGGRLRRFNRIEDAFSYYERTS